MQKVAKLRNESWIVLGRIDPLREYEREKTGANRLAPNRVRTLPSPSLALLLRTNLYFLDRIEIVFSADSLRFSRTLRNDTTFVFRLFFVI